MLVYRIGKTKFAKDLSGEGARLHGARWNHPLVACLYTSASRAHAILEYTVNVNMDDIPRALSITSIEIPEDILELNISDLPGNWKEHPSPASTRDFGTDLLRKAEFPVIRVPSAVIPDEFNYLVNPLHPKSRHCKIIGVTDFVYDIRIKI